MRDLSKVRIWRGGQSGYMVRLSPQQAEIGISAGAPPVPDAPLGLKFSFEIPSKGGGTTKIRLCFPYDDFKEIASAMMTANPIEARRAFALATLEDLAVASDSLGSGDPGL